MEKSDLQKLKHEVLDQGLEAALPCNLPDIWLKMLTRDLEMLQEEKNGLHCHLSLPLAIIIHILYGKQGGNDVEIFYSEEELFQCLEYLRIETALEMIRRNSKFAIEPATLKTIFTNRDVHMAEQPLPSSPD